ncbi:flagellar biosynthesis protein FlhF [Dyella sp. LX-66]|uniref:flagellar biosynthesis protein FlhF n=1 Tax=unclassified Dyella TaxID=2634549 RepID=UPI001BDFEA66|nr:MULTISPECIES: flagellar biosynthesis protein FlhF [unclassified Dyella]MBT2115974.1 flagellar biosynthesis protein FlhF [Dyella sp. LX-1]MBT2137984.1 flagellar biosynthesis protein FlhF [Dyella sp. LX-66]
MKIKRFVAADMRQAMREVREEQGPDAVILSTRRLDEGVEIIAAVDYDESLVREAARSGEPLPTEVRIVRERAAEPPALPPKPRRAPAPAPVAPVAAPVQRAPVAPVVAPVAAAPVAAAKPEPAATPAEPAPLHPMVEQAALDTARMRAELGSLRELLESQMASLAWNDLQRRHPLRGRVLRDMTRIGIEPDVARRLADELPDRLSADQARYLPLGVLSRSLAITGYDVAASGGVVALVGPTGVGKTTTIAKLAARAVLRHGASQVALVSTDNYRIGAAAQLEHYGRLLGTRVFPAHDAESLREVLDVLRGRRVVLVDTAGVAGSDPRLEQQMQLLRAAGELRTCLVLAANAQAQAIDDMVRAFLPQQPQACILTKLDEAPSLGGALSALIRHRLPLDYTTDGQRVPEDLATADARVLVCRAAQVLKGSAPAVDEGYMAERFGLAMAGAR